MKMTMSVDDEGVGSMMASSAQALESWWSRSSAASARRSMTTKLASMSATAADVMVAGAVVRRVGLMTEPGDLGSSTCPGSFDPGFSAFGNSVAPASDPGLWSSA